LSVYLTLQLVCVGRAVLVWEPDNSTYFKQGARIVSDVRASNEFFSFFPLNYCRGTDQLLERTSGPCCVRRCQARVARVGGGPPCSKVRLSRA
jgi:hypothetical protein